MRAGNDRSRRPDRAAQQPASHGEEPWEKSSGRVELDAFALTPELEEDFGHHITRIRFNGTAPNAIRVHTVGMEFVEGREGILIPLKD